MKLNCWEIMGYKRLPEEETAKEYGVCPAFTETQYNGVNGGHNGGRACWAVAGTFALLQTTKVSRELKRGLHFVCKCQRLRRGDFGAKSVQILRGYLCLSRPLTLGLLYWPAIKRLTCLSCKVFKTVMREEGPNFKMALER